MFGTEHHELVVKPDAVSVVPQMVWHYNEPFADSSALPSFELCEMARGFVTVAFNGDGEDEAFLGWIGTWRRLSWTRGWTAVPQAGPRAGGRGGAAALPNGHEPGNARRERVRRFTGCADPGAAQTVTGRG